jgi:hypothetical protein
MRIRTPFARLPFALTVPLLLASCVMAGREGSGLSARAADGAAVADTMLLPPVQGQPLAQPGFSPVVAAPSAALVMAPADRLRATVCLASAVYYEAAHEPDAGQRAVAQVVLNRMRHPEWPNTVCGVVYEGSNKPGCQFSFACDGAEARRFAPAIWARSRAVAEQALAGSVYAPVGDATFYHTHEVTPSWRLRLQKVAVIGSHIFYRMPGGERRSDIYRGGEAVPSLKQFMPASASPSSSSSASISSVPAMPSGLSVSIPVTSPASVALPGAAAPTMARKAPNPPPSPSTAPPLDGDIRPEWANSGQAIEGR